MKGRCKIDLLIVCGLILMGCAIIAGIIFYGLKSEHLDPIPAMIVSGFLGYLGRGAVDRMTNSGEQKPEEPRAE